MALRERLTPSMPFSMIFKAQTRSLSARVCLERQTPELFMTGRGLVGFPLSNRIWHVFYSLVQRYVIPVIALSCFMI